VFSTIIKIVLGVAVVGVVAVAVLSIVPTPATCTPGTSLAATSDAQARWDAWAKASAPVTVTFTEADATSVLRGHLGAASPISDPVVHFCGDGTAQVEFGYKIGPATVKGVAEGTISATSPLTVDVTAIRVGGLPSSVTAPVVDTIKGIAKDAGSLGLAGPVKTVKVSTGQVVVGS